MWVVLFVKQMVLKMKLVVLFRENTHNNQMRTFKNQFKKPCYGLSLFTNLESLKNKVDSLPVLNDSTNAYAKGFTTIKRGISTKENKEHHVEYFLYDYENNSPKDDFSIIEVRKKHE